MEVIYGLGMFCGVALLYTVGLVIYTQRAERRKAAQRIVPA